MKEEKELYVLEIGTSSSGVEAGEEASEWGFFVEGQKGIEEWVAANKVGGLIRGPIDDKELTRVIREYYKGLPFAGVAEVGVGWKSAAIRAAEDLPREGNDLKDDSGPSGHSINTQAESSSLRGEIVGDEGIPPKRKRGRPRRVLENPSG